MSKIFTFKEITLLDGGLNQNKISIETELQRSDVNEMGLISVPLRLLYWDGYKVIAVSGQGLPMSITTVLSGSVQITF